MNLKQLKYIVEIADCHPITKASQKLFVSQPYLSKVVSDFEARANKQIFHRYNNGLELTVYGRKVYLLAQSIIHQMDLLEHLEKEEIPQNSCTKLSFSVGNFIMKNSLLLDYCSTSHVARTDVDFCETTIEECIQNVEKTSSEFAVIVADDFQKTLLMSILARKGLESIELDEGHPYYHLHREHPLANQKRISADRLIQYPFVRLKIDEYSALSRKKLKEEYPNISVRKYLVVSHYPTCLNLIKNSGAFMIGNKWQISELEKMGICSVRSSSLNYKVYLLLIKKKAVPFSAEAKHFIHLFKDSYGLDGA